MSNWQVEVSNLTDIYSETRVVDMLRTVDEVALERTSGAGGIHIDVQVPTRSMAQLIKRMIRSIDSRAHVSSRPRFRARGLRTAVS